MARHTVKLLATIGAFSAFALALSSGAGAVEVEVNTPHVNIPRINVPKPHVNVPTVNNLPTVNLRHHRLSKGTDTLTNENKGNGTTTTTTKTPFVGPSNGPTDVKGVTTTVNSPVVGPSNGTGSAGAKIIIESVGGSGTPTQVQQQNAAAAAAAAAAIGGAASGAGSPGGPNIPPAKAWNPSEANNVDGVLGPGQTTPVVGINPNNTPPYGSAAYYNYLTGGGENAAYAADMSGLQAAAQQEGLKIDIICKRDPHAPECKKVPCREAALYPGCTTYANPAETALQDFNAYMNYLLYLLGLTQDSAQTGMSWTPQETADIEAAITACLQSPSTCAATIANLNAELAGLGVPTVFDSGFFGSFQVLSTPAQITSSADASFFGGTIAPPNNTLSFAVGFWQQAAANEP